MRTTLSAALVAMLVFAQACGSDKPQITETPDPQLPNGIFAAIVDEQEYEPTVATVSVTATHITVVSSVGALSFTVSVAATLPGFYSIAPTREHFAEFVGPGTQRWRADMTGGSGAIRYTGVTGSQLDGFFSFILAPVPGTGAVGDKVVASGLVNLKY